MIRRTHANLTMVVVAGWISSLWSLAVCAQVPTVSDGSDSATPPPIAFPLPDELAPRPDEPGRLIKPADGMPLEVIQVPPQSTTDAVAPNSVAPDSVASHAAMAATPVNRWWEPQIAAPLLDSPQWVSFDLHTIMMDALAHNPRIAAVTYQTCVAMEQIVQQDAVFDPQLLLSSKLGSTNDPVGNTLTTGGPSRLVEDSWTHRGGMVKTNRDGTKVDLSQQLGYQDSNSLFFVPNDQGNARLSLSVTKPLRNGAGQLYNERLIVQARIDAKLTNQQMREEVQERLASTMTTYWQLYQARCQLIQLRALLERGIELQNTVIARRDFDVGDLEISKVRTRIVRRQDQLIKKELELRNLQTQLVALVASESLKNEESPLEMIPIGAPVVVDMNFDLKDAVVEALNHRMDVRSAALDMESASLELAVSRNELLPQLNAIAGGYLAGLNGDSAMLRSFGDQFSLARPGVNAGVEYEIPYGRRAAKARNRAAHQQFLQMTERYREAVIQTRAEVEIASRNLQTALAALKVKQQVYEEAVRQETLIRQRWEMLGPEGRNGALVLEDLLDQQENRSIAEQDLVAGEVAYLVAMVDLQQAMGTLLISEGISSDVARDQKQGSSSVQWQSQPLRDLPPQSVGPIPTVPQLEPETNLIDSESTP